jgi:hypothetical protein
MTWQGKQNRSNDKAPVYEIRLRGQINKDWVDWLDGMSISYEGADTILRGKIVDQSALRGILTRIWDLNRTVISVNQSLNV